MGKIIKLTKENFETKYPDVYNWSTGGYKHYTEKFRKEFLNRNRETFIYDIDGKRASKVSIVYDQGDPEYTIPNVRVYLSNVGTEYKYCRQGFASLLIAHAVEYVKAKGYTEMSVGVDLDNFNALRLYVKNGFTTIIRVDEDENGEYIKLLKKL